MQPDDLSIPRGDNKIKEKLNLHLKKRLQETGKSLSSSAAEPPPPPSSSSSSTCPPVSPAASAAAAGPSSGSKTKKQKTKHSPSTSSATSASAGSSFYIGAAAGCSSSKNPDHMMLSPGALGGGNSNDTTNSSFNSVDLDPDANLSNDGLERAAGEKSGSKVNSKPDIFTVILNEKKSSLMRDPEVIKFLTDLMEKRDKP
ncbi:ubiquilin-4-like [Ochlerotatus camptorhynchus]|uniref:ubiquilin-4-like n=1 Tax=Ochlerotatus camptorhynchus TaxID=644619 RepID=UPI0031D9C197